MRHIPGSETPALQKIMRHGAAEPSYSLHKALSIVIYGEYIKCYGQRSDAMRFSSLSSLNWRILAQESEGKMRRI